MGKSGYTSLSIDEKKYATLRKNWDQLVGNGDHSTHFKDNVNDTFTTWAMRVLESAVKRELLVNSMFPNFKFIGQTENGCIIQDKKEIVQINKTKNTITCSVHTEICDHCIFAALNSKF